MPPKPATRLLPKDTMVMDSRSGSRVGTQFGPYALRSLLGKGGMGEVYEAYDTVKQRTVALKVLPTHLADDPRYALRFRRESQAAARLNDPHIIPIHDWGEIDGELFIDMRLIHGSSLGALLRESGPMEPARAVAIVEQIASALDSAHTSGLVHRDIKPDNILLTPKDFAYLADFGIAFSETDTQLTTVGTVIGSYAYMAPERFEQSAAVDGSTDIYSLTCVLYQILTGTIPFDTSSIQQAIAAHLYSPPPAPSHGRPWVPQSFDRVVARGMAKSPADRYRSAGEFAHTVRTALYDNTIRIVKAGPPTPPSPTDPVRTLVAGPPPPETYVDRSAPRPDTSRSGSTRILAVLGTVAIVVAAAAAWALWPKETVNRSSTASEPSGRAAVLEENSVPQLDSASPPNEGSAVGGDSCGTVRFPATGDVAEVSVESGPVTCSTALSIFDRYLNDPSVEHSSGNTWPAEFDGWLCIIPTATSAALQNAASVCTNDELGTRVTARPTGSEQVPPSRIEPAEAAPLPLRGQGDLGLVTPMAVPACDGSGIVVVANATAPGSYAEEVTGYLAAYPGASYLRTDRSCASLRQATDEGNPIYAVFFPAGSSTVDVCAAVRSRGGNAYGKWLDNTTDPRIMVEC